MKKLVNCTLLDSLFKHFRIEKLAKKSIVRIGLLMIFLVQAMDLLLK